MKRKLFASTCAAVLSLAPAAFAQDDAPPASSDPEMQQCIDDCVQQRDQKAQKQTQSTKKKSTSVNVGEGEAEADVDVQAPMEEPAPLPPADVDVDVSQPVEIETTPSAEPMQEAPREDADVDVDIYPAAPTTPAPVVVTPAPAEETAQQERNTSNIIGDYFGKWGHGSLKAMAGGGDFTEDNIQNQTSANVLWDVRALFGAHSPIGVEAAYVGSSRGVDVGGDIPSGADALVSNGLEGDLRLALPIKASEMVDIRPFAFGGLGWQYMTLWGDGAVDGANDDGDHIMTVPAGAGIEFGFGPLTLDGRYTYRHAVGSDLFGNATAEFDDPDALHQWNVTGGIGLQF